MPTGARREFRSTSPRSRYLTIKRTQRASRRCSRAKSISCRTCRCRTSSGWRSTPNLEVNYGPENRTIFFGMDVASPELATSDVKGKNPFADKRVRQAMNMAIDRAAIQRVVMRGQSVPAGIDRAAVRQRLHQGARQSRPRSMSPRPRRCWRMPATRTASGHAALPQRPLHQ